MFATVNIKLQPGDVDISHRLKGKEGGTRPIIVRFATQASKKKIYSCNSKLKGSTIVIKEDLTRSKLALLKEVSGVVPSRLFCLIFSQCTCIFIYTFL